MALTKWAKVLCEWMKKEIGLLNSVTLFSTSYLGILHVDTCNMFSCFFSFFFFHRKSISVKTHLISSHTHTHMPFHYYSTPRKKKSTSTNIIFQFYSIPYPFHTCLCKMAPPPTPTDIPICKAFKSTEYLSEGKEKPQQTTQEEGTRNQGTKSPLVSYKHPKCMPCFVHSLENTCPVSL